MAQRCGPPFDFDLNEPLPEDDDVANEPSPAQAPEPMREPSPRVLLLPSPENTLPSPQLDSLPPPPTPPAPEPSPRDPLPAPVPEPSAHDPLTVPVSESSAHDPLPSPRDPLHLPSPVLDLDAPLSSLDDDYDEEYDYDEADLPPPQPLPPHGLVPIAAAQTQSSSSVDTLGALPSRPDRHGERTSSQEPFAGDAAARPSSPENSAPRGLSSGTASSHRSRRRPYCYDPRDDDAISKQRRVGSYDDDDAGSSRSGSRRSELASLAPYEQGGGGRHAPATHGEPGAPPRNRRRRRRQQPPQHGYRYAGSIPKQQGRGWEQPQGLRGGGQERPQAHQSHGPFGPEATTKVGYSSYYPLLSGSYEDGRQGPEQEPINGNGGYHHQRREAPPPSSRPRGREDPYYGRRSQAHGPPKAGGYQHSREGPSLRPSSGAHGRDGGRPRPPEQPINGGGAYQQMKAPRGGERFPDRPYHPYARDGGAAFDGANGGHQGRREHPPNYEHRRRDNTQQRAAGGPARGRQYYCGD